MSDPYGSYPQSPAPYGQPYGMVPREHPQGTLVLVLGILGIIMTILLALGLLAGIIGLVLFVVLAASSSGY